MLSGESVNKAGDRATYFWVGFRDNLCGLPASAVTVISASIVSSSPERSEFGSWLLLCDLDGTACDIDLEDADRLKPGICACMPLLSAPSSADISSSNFISSRAWSTASGVMSRVSSAIVFCRGGKFWKGCGGDKVKRGAKRELSRFGKGTSGILDRNSPTKGCRREELYIAAGLKYYFNV